jgi:hypothetical protein
MLKGSPAAWYVLLTVLTVFPFWSLYIVPISADVPESN